MKHEFHEWTNDTNEGLVKDILHIKRFTAKCARRRAAPRITILNGPTGIFCTRWRIRCIALCKCNAPQALQGAMHVLSCVAPGLGAFALSCITSYCPTHYSCNSPIRVIREMKLKTTPRMTRISEWREFLRITPSAAPRLAPALPPGWQGTARRTDPPLPKTGSPAKPCRV